MYLTQSIKYFCKCNSLCTLPGLIVAGVKLLRVMVFL